MARPIITLQHFPTNYANSNYVAYIYIDIYVLICRSEILALAHPPINSNNKRHLTKNRKGKKGTRNQPQKLFKFFFYYFVINECSGILTDPQRTR